MPGRVLFWVLLAGIVSAGCGDGATGLVAIDGKLMHLLDNQQRLFDRQVVSIELGAVSLATGPGGRELRSVLYVEFENEYRGLYLATLDW